MGYPNTKSEYTAHFQPLAGCIRVFEPGGEFGDPYVWSCTALCQGDTVELLGAMEAPSNAVRRAVQDMLVDMEFRWLRMTRIKHGKCRSSLISIRRRSEAASKYDLSGS